MDVGQIHKVARALPRFLEEFGDCFGRCDTRRYLRVYVDGQMSNLHRKSVEPMAFHGWAKAPAVLVRPTPREMRKKGYKRGSPRLSATAASVSEVRNLLKHSPAFQSQAWTPIHITTPAHKE